MSRIATTRIPALLIARIADSRPPPGPFHAHFALLHPGFRGFLCGFVRCLLRGKGVPLREPRKPRAPDDDCATRFPSRSVIEISVLLNDAAIYTIPMGIFFFSFLRKTFFLPAVVAFAITLFC